MGFVFEILVLFLICYILSHSINYLDFLCTQLLLPTEILQGILAKLDLGCT